MELSAFGFGRKDGRRLIDGVNVYYCERVPNSTQDPSIFGNHMDCKKLSRDAWRTSLLFSNVYLSTRDGRLACAVV